MTILDIILIIIGCFLVVFSYVITERISDAHDKTSTGAVTEVWGDKEEVTIKARVKDIVSDKSEEVIDTVEDRLCHLSNEKIMEFKEYSDQVMESIKNEHKQAVFLYNMLSEKENDIKKLLNNLDKKYALLSDKVNRLILKIKERSESAAKKQDEQANKKPAVKNIPEKPVKENTPVTNDISSKIKSIDNKLKDSTGNANRNAEVVNVDSVNTETSVSAGMMADSIKVDDIQGNIPSESDNLFTDDIPSVDEDLLMADIPSVTDEYPVSDIDIPSDVNENVVPYETDMAEGTAVAEAVDNNSSGSGGLDRNSRILSLWNEGKSVIDISRQLGIGQGEVKLVIDLFKGA